jgi:hypothetical protein
MILVKCPVVKIGKFAILLTIKIHLLLHVVPVKRELGHFWGRLRGGQSLWTLQYDSCTRLDTRGKIVLKMSGNMMLGV